MGRDGGFAGDARLGPTAQATGTRAILDNLLRFREGEELTDRVHRLEEAIESVGFNGAAL